LLAEPVYVIALRETGRSWPLVCGGCRGVGHGSGRQLLCQPPSLQVSLTRAPLRQSPAEGVGTSGGGEGCDTDEATSGSRSGRKRSPEGAHHGRRWPVFASKALASGAELVLGGGSARAGRAARAAAEQRSPYRCCRPVERADHCKGSSMRAGPAWCGAADAAARQARPTRRAARRRARPAAAAAGPTAPAAGAPPSARAWSGPWSSTSASLTPSCTWWVKGMVGKVG